MKNPKNILITGASSGLGRGLAVAYSQSGVNLFLGARRIDELQETKKLCTELKAAVFLQIIDVEDENATKNWVEEIEKNFSEKRL